MIEDVARAIAAVRAPTPDEDAEPCPLCGAQPIREVPRGAAMLSCCGSVGGRGHRLIAKGDSYGEVRMLWTRLVERRALRREIQGVARGLAESAGLQPEQVVIASPSSTERNAVEEILRGGS